MKGLLVKDFLLMIKSKKVILFMLFIGIIGGINDISFATGYILMVLAILSLSTISYDEANHGLNTLFTLPISKSDYVKEKYLFSLIITGIGFVFVTILGCFSKSGFSIKGRQRKRKNCIVCGCVWMYLLIRFLKSIYS